MLPRFGPQQSEEAFWHSIQEWDRDVHAYEKVTGETFDKSIRTAMVLYRAPVDLRRHLRLMAEDVESDYEALISRLRAYIMAGRKWNIELRDRQVSGGAVPMEVDTVQKGKSTGRGFSAVALDVCLWCGKRGHWAADWKARLAASGKGAGPPTSK